MSVAPIIHIGGWPGAGKHTIGRLVADRLGGRLIHNHLMLDAARALYARDTPESVAMREEVRALILSHARKLPLDVPIILTDALNDQPEAMPLFQPTLDLAKDRNAPLHCVVLDLSLEENRARLTNPARSGGDKLTDTDILDHIRVSDRLLVWPGATVLDVTHLTAADAAKKICNLVAPT